MVRVEREVVTEEGSATRIIEAAAPPRQRVVSLDQFRGYTVAGMFFVNFLGEFAAIPAIFKHHGAYCSYADTIMPQFFFAVGFAYRLTFLRGIAKEGVGKTCRHAVNRNLGLILVGILLYHLDGGFDHYARLQELGVGGFLTSAFRVSMFQALVHIGLTGLWVLPVIAAAPLTRIAFMAASGAIHLILSYWFYFDWGQHTGILDGGQLGFLSWTIPTLLGSLAYDLMRSRGPMKALVPLFSWAAALMAFGYAISCLNAVNHVLHGGGVGQGIGRWFVEPPFVPPIRPTDMWTMNQLAGSVSYTTFGAGFSLLLYAVFVILCDIGPFRLGVFRTFGSNALAAYLIHDFVQRAVAPWVPLDASLWYALLGFGVFFGLTYFLVRYLERREIYLRL